MTTASGSRECAVSIVIPAYRVTPYIADAIDSVLEQTFQNFELIVVNDGCPDSIGLEQVLKRYEERIVYLNHPVNRGVSAARNTGVRAARGEFIAFLDGDDVYEPEYLEVQLDQFRKHPEADMIYGSALIFGDDPSVGMPIEDFRPSNGPVIAISILQGKVTVLLTSMIRREMLLRAGLFDEGLSKCEDFDLWIRMAKMGAVILHHSQPISRYRVRGDSASADHVVMLQNLLSVGDKLERETAFTAEESDALAEARVRWTAEIDLELGKTALRQGNYAEAAERFRSSNRYLKRTKLGAAAAALTWTPNLVAWAMNCRDALAKLRTAARASR
jgi:glycosyltransferase involved in cell wall biosynthesis